MARFSLLNTVQKLISLGKSFAIGHKEEKRVIWLNTASVVWLNGYAGIFILGYLFVPEFLSYKIIAIFSVHAFIILATIWLQSKGKLVFARWLFVTSAYLEFAVYPFIGFAKFHPEFYMIIPLLVYKLLFKSSWVDYLLLLISVGSFLVGSYVSNDFSINYNKIHFVNYFIILFIIVNELIRINDIKEDELIHANKELEEFQKAQTRFFTTISHELRTPLTLAFANQQKIQNEIKELPINIEFDTQPYGDQLTRISEIIDELMRLAKFEDTGFKLKKQKINLSSLLQRIRLSFEPLFENKSISFEYQHLSNQHIYISGDFSYIERAISNLLINASKYTLEGGNVQLILSQNQNNQAIIIVEDDGVGINDSDQVKIFKQFQQGNNSINKSSGTGIGLYFTKQIVQLHGGQIFVESTLDEGSTFKIILSTITKSNQEEDQKSEVHSTYSTQDKRKAVNHQNTILIVDDSNEIRSYLKDVLIHYKVLEAEDGRKGLEIYNKYKLEIKLVISDYRMPIMDGLSFLKELRKIDNYCPFIVLTASIDLDKKLDFLRIGVEDYIVKPFHEEELLARIEFLINNQHNRKTYIEEEELDPTNDQFEKEDIFIKDLKAYIFDNVSKSGFGVEDICDHFASTQSTLYRKVKSKTGLTTKSLIQEVKLQKAKDIISQNPYIATKDLVSKMGYSNTTYFVNQYKRRFGKHPFTDRN